MPRYEELCPPARIHAGGIVFEVDELNATIYVKAWQQIFGAPLLTPLTILAMMRPKDLFLREYQELPAIQSYISFTGDLLTVEIGTAWVLVDDHSYLTEVNPDE